MNVNAFKFRKKPVVIEAYQWQSNDPLNLRGKDWPEWLNDACRSGVVIRSFEGYATVCTLEGEMRAEVGDWIIRGIKGELYPCKPDIFAATYESDEIDLEADDFPDARSLQEEGKYAARADWQLEDDNGIDLQAADFSDALMWLKEGKRVQRAGWNGKGQWAEIVRNSGLVFRSEFDNAHYEVADGLMLKNAQGTVVQWLPSVGDLLATDWQVVS